MTDAAADMIDPAAGEGAQPEALPPGAWDHKRALRAIAAAFHDTSTQRVASLRDLQFYHGKQWTDDERRILQKRGQEPTIAPFIRRKVNFLLGMERKTTVDPEAVPTDAAHEDHAHIASDLLKNLDDELQLTQVRGKIARALCIEYAGVVEVGAQPDRANPGAFKPSLIAIQPDEFFYDPLSREHDFSDASYLGIIREMDADMAESLFGPGISEHFSATNDAGFHFEPVSTTMTQFMWGDRERRRVRVAQLYYRTPAGWLYMCLTQMGIHKHTLSPYVDEYGAPDHPYEAQSIYVNDERERCGVVRDMIDSQREYNRRRSRLFFEALSRRTFRREGAVLDAAAFKQQINSPNGDIVLNANAQWGKDVGILRDDHAGLQAEMLAESRAILDMQGPNAALQGRGVENQSGRAIEAQQSAGMAEEDVFFSALADLTLRVYRKLWARSKQYITYRKPLRIQRDDGSSAWAVVNEPTPMIDPATGAMMRDPATGAPLVEVRNELAKIGAQINIKLVPEAVSSEARERDRLLEFARAGVAIPGRVVIETSGLRSKDKILRMMQEADAPPQAPPSPPPEALRAAAARAALDEARARQADANALTTIGEAVAAGVIRPPTPAPPQPQPEFAPPPPADPAAASGAIPPPGFGRDGPPPMPGDTGGLPL